MDIMDCCKIHILVIKKNSKLYVRHFIKMTDAQ